MPISLEKIIELLKKTGDKRIVLDEKGNPVYVLLGFKDYQKLISEKTLGSEVLSPDPIDLEGNNDDISAWQQADKEENLDNWQDLASVSSDTSDEKSLNEADNSQKDADSEQKYYFEPIE